MKKLAAFFVVLTIFGTFCYAQNPLKIWSFNTIPENINGNFRMVAGVDGEGLKLDGFTTFIAEKPEKLAALKESFTIECWIALAAYPWNWCPLITQMKEETGGFSFEIGPRGELGLKMHAGRTLHSVISDEKIMLREWTHVAAVYDSGVGMSLYINGKVVANYSATGKSSFAAKEEIRIGMNYEAVFPSNRIGENGITPYWFSLDGILDELIVSPEALNPEEVAENYSSIDLKQVTEPEISLRKLPRVESTGSFEAYYTQLEYYHEWDEQWPVGPDADIVVTFENSPVQLVFWRGTRYSPAWVSDNNQWMCDQSVETWNGEEGCKEHMQDRHCLYSHVRLIENTPARKVIHWRYAPVSAYNTFWMANEKTGWNVWVDEYYYVYPDATGIRKVTWKTDYFGHPRQFQETLPLTAAGETRDDIMELNYLKVANQKGEQMQLVYTENPRQEKDLNIIDSPNIQQHNFKSKYDPFIIFEPGNRMHYIMDRALANLDYPGSCNHWPVGQAYCDGRVTQASDRPAHFLGFPISDPIVHDVADGRSYWAGLYGMKDVQMDELITLSKSWNQSPELLIESKGYTGGDYHKALKCYVINSNGESKQLKLSLHASDDSPLVNPVIQINNWNHQEFELSLNGKKLKPTIDYKSGLVNRIEGTNLIIWINYQTNEPIVLEINVE